MLDLKSPLFTDDPEYKRQLEQDGTLIVLKASGTSTQLPTCTYSSTRNTAYEYYY
jgi:hypothetical protein